VRWTRLSEIVNDRSDGGETTGQSAGPIPGARELRLHNIL
jgi:hypothetical protein